ncbi:MAG: hypothetical protein E7558_02605 [Ruminococcaceae bacterium]|nr:hypothetical protein [Oscillospiraceae bacterium]
MKSKRLLCFILTSMLLISACCGSFVSLASVYYENGQAKATPGQTKTYVPLEDYNYAWIDDVVVRDSSSSVTALTLVPVTESPYSHTLDQFVEECNNYTSLFNASEEVLESTFVTSLKALYYSLIASGVITETNTVMRTYNEEHGIVYPFVESELTQMYTAIVYVSLKTDLYGAILDKQIEIPRGTTVEGAIVNILSSMCNMNVPANVNSLSSFTYLFAEDYVVDEKKYPVSDEPSETEVYYWVRLAAADNAGYSVPTDVPYSAVTAEQEEYVLYAYYASILTQRYEVMVDPLLLRAALLSGEKEKKIPELVLKAMLDEVSISYEKNETTESLFEKAKTEGFFDLEAEFYTDIYNYRVYVSPENEQVWFTSYLVADQLVDGDIDCAETYINGNKVKNTSTTGVKLDNDIETTVVIEVLYDDGERSDKATYTFVIEKNANAADVNGNLNIDIADPIDSVLDSLSGAADNYMTGVEIPTAPTTKPNGSNTITTYPVNGIGSGNKFETYPTDANGNVIGNNDALTTAKQEQTTVQVLDKSLTETVKENPEYVATPIGLLAVGASAGYIFFRRRKNELFAEENNDIKVDDVEI